MARSEGGIGGLAAGGTLILLDSEGIASMEQDETYDAQIFSLALLLSSYFVLNSMGVIDEAAIDRLFLISEISKRVCAAASPPAAMGTNQEEAMGEAVGRAVADGWRGCGMTASHMTAKTTTG